MFSSRKKKLLVKELRRARKVPLPGDGSGRKEDSVLRDLLQKFNLEQLEQLWKAVASQGMEQTSCVLVEHGTRPQDQHLVFCKTWRWPDIRTVGDIRRLPVCKSAGDRIYTCCNPYHWSKICELPPPPYSYCMEQFQPEDRPTRDALCMFRDSYTQSLTTNGDNSSGRNVWCQLAYWEKKQRVGHLFPVERDHVNIFWDTPCGNGMSIKELSRDTTNEEIVKARLKIGLGITISREPNGIWVYNRSSIPIFVNSITLKQGRNSQPIRVPADCCLCVFDFEKASCMDLYRVSDHEGPIDAYSITISFGKGWGQCYSRVEISSCPCWIEILLAPCR